MSLKKRLQEKDEPPLLGAFVGLAEPAMVEMVGRAGFDFVILDGEHGCFTPIRMEECLRAADMARVPSVVRLPRMDPVAIQAALDLGAHGIQVPSVDTPEQAETAVASSRFPPRGRRGYGSTTRATGYGFRGRAEVMATAEERDCVTIQIETKRGVDNLADILAVDGIDSVFIGTSDLSLEFGYASPAAPEMEPLLRRITGRVAEAGKVCGVHIVDWQAIESHVRLGVRYFTVSALTVMGSALRDMAEGFRRKAESI